MDRPLYHTPLVEENYKDIQFVNIDCSFSCVKRAGFGKKSKIYQFLRENDLTT